MLRDPFHDRPDFHQAKVFWTRGDWIFRPWSGPHHHEALEFQLVERGAYAVEVGGVGVSLRAGDLLWLRPRERHRAVVAPADLAISFCMFRPAFAAAVCTSPWTAPLREPGPPLLFRLRPAAVPRLAEVLRAGESLTHPEEILAHHHRLLVDAWRACTGGAAVAAAALHPAVVQAAQRIAADPVMMELPPLAAAVGLSYGRLSELFSRQMGITLVRYRSHQRLLHIARRVGGGWTRGLGDAARLCGFASYAHFHRTFRRVMGCRPSDWLERVRAGEAAW